jgi:hypothetical protein
LGKVYDAGMKHCQKGFFAGQISQILAFSRLPDLRFLNLAHYQDLAFFLPFTAQYGWTN